MNPIPALRQFLLLLLLLLPLAGQRLNAQRQVTAQEQARIIAQVEEASRQKNSMQCDFSQVKTMKLLSRDMLSSGTLSFVRPDRLRWQYTRPYDYTFVLNGSKVGIRSAQTGGGMNVQNEKMFSQIAHVILQCITGGNLRSTSDFDLELFEAADHTYFARLHPRKKELRQIYSLLELYFNPSLTMVTRVQMVERSGDVTVVSMTNVKDNIALDETLFSLP